MTVRITQVDAFTDRPFAGNPAAVCILPTSHDDSWMQLVAREMNLSETAFLVRQRDGFQLRWFTPTVEVELCGHATLASSHVLWELGYAAPQEVIRFFTLSGLLTARRLGPWIELDFPAEPAVPAEAPAGLLEALGIAPLYVGRNRFDYLIEVGCEEELRALKPDFARLSAATSRGVMVTCPAASQDFDFVSRFFAPAVGVNEDPVTGSSHCCLGPYWAKRLHKHELIAFQASARGGVVRVRLEGDRAILGGHAVTIWSGELSVL